MAKIISNDDDLRDLLAGKPREWAQLIALRSALRVLPLIALESSNTRFYGVVFRANLVSWAALKFPTHDTAIDAYSAYAAARTAGGSTPNGTAAAAADAAADAARTASTSASAYSKGVNAAYAADAAAAAADAAAAAAAAATAANAAEVIWREVNRDIAMLERRPGTIVGRLIAQPLWNGAIPEEFDTRWRELVTTSLEQDANLWIWRDWYHRQLQGAGNAFLMDAEEDQKLVLRLIQQGQRFWNRDLTEVNADIARWIAEMRDAVPEPQNTLAPIFVGDTDGIIDVDVGAGNEAIARGQEAIERHGEAKFAIRRAIESCTDNAGRAVRDELKRYEESLGDAIDGLHLGQLIQRGEALRQEYAARSRKNPDSDLEFITDTTLLELGKVVVAHNLLVGLDPALAMRDQARLGPDVSTSAIDPDDTRKIANDAAKAGVLTPEAKDVLLTAAAIAPAQPVPLDRRSLLLNETVRNFGRQALTMLHAAIGVSVRTTMAVTVVGMTASGASVGVAGAAAGLGAGMWGCHKLGQWALKNEEWFRRTFAGNDTMLRVVDHVMNELRKLPMA